jgi:hypothetical protein
MPSVRCHKSRSIAAAIGIAFLPSSTRLLPYYPNSYRSLSLFLRTRYCHTRTIPHLVRHIGPAKQQPHSLYVTSSNSPDYDRAHCTMDNITPQLLPFQVPSLDALKLSTPRTNSEHFEHINEPAMVERREHLPRGISETDEEKTKRFYIGSIDCGTTSSRFLIFNGEGTPVASHQIEFDNIYPESG